MKTRNVIVYDILLRKKIVPRIYQRVDGEKYDTYMSWKLKIYKSSKQKFALDRNVVNSITTCYIILSAFRKSCIGGKIYM